MAYFEQIKQSKTWVCPKSGYYKIVCVGGGGGGGGAGYYSPGVTRGNDSDTPAISITNGGSEVRVSARSSNNSLGDSTASTTHSIPEYALSNQLRAMFKKRVRFISACTGGTSGGAGGSTSFGNLLTASGGAGGNGGGAEYGSALNDLFLSPQGGESVSSPGGSGVSLTSCYISDVYALNIITCATSNSIVNTNNLNPFRAVTLPYETGIDGVSACSGAGGAGGNVETLITFIEKGTEIPCTIGEGGIGGNKGSLTINDSIKYNLPDKVTGYWKGTSSTGGAVNGFPIYHRHFQVDGIISSYANCPNVFIKENSHIVDTYFKIHIPISLPFRLSANIPGGGGGGGFTLAQSGGKGSSIKATNSWQITLGQKTLPFMNTLLSEVNSNVNGGASNCNGIGYGAGGAGGGNTTNLFLGTDLATRTHTYSFSENTSTPGESTHTWTIAAGELEFPIVDYINSPRAIEPSTGNSGANGCICIQEVS